MDFEELSKHVQKAADDLAEHGDCVLILVSRYDGAKEGLTEFVRKGCGNWWARRGMAQAFLDDDSSRDHASDIARALKSEED